MADDAADHEVYGTAAFSAPAWARVPRAPDGERGTPVPDHSDRRLIGAGERTQRSVLARQNDSAPKRRVSPRDTDGLAVRHSGGSVAAASTAVPREPASAQRVGRVAGSVGGLLSAVLVAGLGVWGYRLALRDVTEVPVVRALTGPMRIAPEDPGGERPAYRGLAVNSVASAGTVAAVAQRVILAPRPVDLDQTDMPVAALSGPGDTGAAMFDEPRGDDMTGGAADAGRVAAAMDAGLLAATTEAAVLSAEPAAVVTPEAGVADALSPEAALNAEVSRAVQADAVEQAVALAVAEEAPGLRGSPRPLARPRSLGRTDAGSAPDDAPVTVAAAAPATETEAFPPGTRLVQLGAFDTAAAARADWDRLNAIYGDAFRGKVRVVQEAVSGGQTFYRLRAQGFADAAAANAFCSVLLFGNTENCIPVLVR